MHIPPEFAARVRTLLGDHGDAWLRDLPALVADLSERWNLTVGDPFELSFNYVAAAWRRDNTEVVLKLSPPWEDGEFEREIRALSLYDGIGISRLLESDVGRRAVLLERLRPGQMLTEIAAEDDDAATSIGADVVRQLWRPASDISDPSPFKPLAEWFLRAFPLHRATYGGAGPFPPGVLEYAEALVPDLLASSPGDVLLHGDFHHYNVLSSERGWLAIDPKGMLGDAGYDAGPFMLNPHMEISDMSRVLLDRRLDILAAELPYDRRRLRDWTIAYAVLSACWSAETPGDEWRPAIAAAQNLIDHA